MAVFLIYDIHIMITQYRFFKKWGHRMEPVSYTHLRAHETVLDLVCRLLLEKKKKNTPKHIINKQNYKNIENTTISIQWYRHNILTDYAP